MSDRTYILDTSAILAYIEDEDGADDVDRILIEAEAGRANVLISFISLTELFYITRREVGEEKALERVQLIRALALRIYESDENINIAAGRLKADHRISLADAYIAALCQHHRGVMVHKDPEFEQLASLIRELRLPYKRQPIDISR